MTLTDLQLMTERDAFRYEEEDSTDWRVSGGKCLDFSEHIRDLHFGGTAMLGTYLHHGRRVPHAWLELPGGDILDATLDQFGVPGGVRRLRPSDPDFARYQGHPAE